MPGDVSFTAAERRILGLTGAGVKNVPVANVLANKLKKKKKKKKKSKGIGEGMADLIQSLKNRGR